MAPKGPGWAPQVFIGTGASLGAFGLTVLFVRWEGLRLDEVGASPDRRSLLRFAIGFLIGLILVALNSAVLWGVGDVRWVRTPQIGFSEAIVTLVAFLSLSVREELAFHGYPLQRLKPVFGLWGAQSIVAFIFALEHVVGGSTWGLALLGAGVGSLLFGMAAIATRGLALPIGLHAAWNTGDWMRGGKGSVGFWKPVVEDAFKERAALIGIASYVLVTCLATLAFWWWNRSIDRSHAPRP
jgi:membrane protease YdiL (CAAX protease family)